MLTTKEIAKEIREELKRRLPWCKFSVTKENFSGGASITVALMEAPNEVFKVKDLGYKQLNHYHLDKDTELTYEGYLVMEKALEIVHKRHWDKSDPMVDYINCKFYIHLNVGKWDKHFKVKGVA